MCRTVARSAIIKWRFSILSKNELCVGNNHYLSLRVKEKGASAAIGEGVRKQLVLASVNRL